MTKDSAYFDLHLRIYPVRILFFFNKSNEEVKKILKKNVGTGLEEADFELSGQIEAICTFFPSGIISMRFRKIPKSCFDMGVVSHEIFHAVYRIMDYVGIPLSDSSEEAYTYLIQFITQETYSKLNKYY